jgi:hypothetical protein
MAHQLVWQAEVELDDIWYCHNQKYVSSNSVSGATVVEPYQKAPPALTVRLLGASL